MDIWAILAIAYAVVAAATFVWLMVTFFGKHPDGALHLDEWEFIGYITLSLMASILWPLSLILVLVIRQK
ncbi:MAG: hypothetical protein WAQ27_02675 [Candidatus Microsaccharimonas sp.]